MEVNLVKLPESGYVGVTRTDAVTEDVTASNAADAATRTNAAAQSQDATHPDKEKKKTNLTDSDMNNLTDALNKFMQNLNADLSFVIHEKTNRMMVRLVDSKTKEVIKEFPPHELLDTLAKISEYVGALLDKKA